MADPDLLATPLRYFLQVAESGSFTAAARALHISQPSLSVAVRKLEEALGATLLHRSRQGVSLTRAGEVLIESARLADSALSRGKEELLALDSDPRGRFVVGCHESLGAYLLPGFMARFLSRHPRIELALHNGNSRAIERAVVERRIDIGLVVNPSGHPDSVIAKLFGDRVGFVVSAARFRRHDGDVASLLDEAPLVVVPELAQTTYLLGALQTQGISATKRLECSSMELVKNLVLDGVGVGILPYRVATHGVPRGRLVRLDGDLPVFDDEITLVRRYDLPTTAGARALLDALKQHAAGMPALDEVLSVA